MQGKLAGRQAGVNAWPRDIEQRPSSVAPPLQHAGGAAERGRARIDADRQAHVGRDAATRRVQRELRLGHAHRLRTNRREHDAGAIRTPEQAGQQAAGRTQLTWLPPGRTGAPCMHAYLRYAVTDPDMHAHVF